MRHTCITQLLQKHIRTRQFYHIQTSFPNRSTITHDESSSAEGAVGYDIQPQLYENLYETLNSDSAAAGNQPTENIYEAVEDLRPPNARDDASEMPGCSAYGRIGGAYGRIDVLGHGIGRIERHLSSSCGSIDGGRYALEGPHAGADATGRISKVSVQWLLVNKWLPLWIANTETGRDYRIIDFLLGQRGDYENLPGGGSRGNEDEYGRDQGPSGSSPPPSGSA